MSKLITKQDLQGQFLSVPVLASVTSESEAAWRKRIFFRRIPFVKVGRSVRVRREDFERWIEERIVPAREAR